ncbi:J domain-containing protein [Lacrimispora sp.]|uniref:J domain-containing protein n=1 Tax=Lacrimispora sp. TaxID=2719234 RepID=UPI0028B105FA|nr:J domain-containing protein [Lacrimispora sp.]
MKYFNNVGTLEELRKQYKELLKKFHPDNPNGSTEATQEINAEYDKLFQILKDKHDNREYGSRTAYDDLKYDFAEDERLREVLQQVISFVGINIEIVGAWIWIDGNTYSYKAELKTLGFKWASDKKKWYFHTEAFRKRSHKKLSIDDIRDYYGSTEVKPEETKKLKQA